MRVENSESWRLEKILSGSHTDVVRSVLWDEEVSFPVSHLRLSLIHITSSSRQNSIIVTAGEDSRVSSWAVPRAGSYSGGTYGSTSQPDDEGDGMDVDMASSIESGNRNDNKIGWKRGRDNEVEMEVERPVMSKRVKSVSFS